MNFKVFYYILNEIIFILLIHNYLTTGVVLKGLTIRKWPYSNMLANGQFEGFSIDLLNEIGRATRMAYTLKLSPEGKVGGWHPNGTVDGMIGQIYRNETDFAIADITVISSRQRYVDFTHPFMKFGLSALIHKDYVSNISSFSDLAQQSDIEYGVKKVGSNLPLIHKSDVISKMYNYWDLNPNALVYGSDEDGVKRVKTSKFAFITEHPFNEYIINRDCDLTVIEDKERYFHYEYAIAMRKDLIFKNVISNAVKHLETNGKLSQLKDKYWNTTKCLEENSVEIIRKPFGKNRNEFFTSEIRDYIKSYRLRNWRKSTGNRVVCFEFNLKLFLFLLLMINTIV